MKMIVDDGDRILEATEEGGESMTVKYLVKHQYLAILLFIFALITADIWANCMHKGICEIIGTDDLNFIQWFIYAVVFTTILWIITMAIKVPLTAAFGY